MKILVFSDTHNYLDNAREVLRRIGGQMDMVLHLGDHDTDAMELKKEFPSLPFHYVLGNNDYSWDTPDKKMVFAGGKNCSLSMGINSGFTGIMTAFLTGQKNKGQMWCSLDIPIVLFTMTEDG